MKPKKAKVLGLATNVPAGAVLTESAGEFAPTRPASLPAPVVMNPVLVAALKDVGGTRRGASAVMCGLGGDGHTLEVPRRLVYTLAPGTTFPVGAYTKTSKGPRNLFEERKDMLGTTGRCVLHSAEPQQPSPHRIN